MAMYTAWKEEGTDDIETVADDTGDTSVSGCNPERTQTDLLPLHEKISSWNKV